MAKDIGVLTQKLFSAKAKKADLNANLKELNSLIKMIEIDLLHEMEEQKLLKVSDQSGTVYISRQVVPKVLNWDEFYEYIRKNNYFHLLERRPSRGAFRESYELGEQVPGVDPVLFDEVRTRKT